MRIIPKKTRVDMEIFKGVGILDIIVATLGIMIVAVLFLYNVPFRFAFIFATIILFIFLLTKFGEDANYVSLLNCVKYLFSKKRFEADEINKVSMVESISDGCIKYKDGTVSKVIEVSPVEFKFFSEQKQDYIVEKVFGNVLRNLNLSESINLIKIDRPVNFEAILNSEKNRVNELELSYKNGIFNEQEYASRKDILDKRIKNLENISKNSNMIMAYHYIAIFAKTAEELAEQIDNACEVFNKSDIETKVLDDNELNAFLKYSYNFAINGEDKEFLPKKIQILKNHVNVDGEDVYCLRIKDYPSLVTNAWGAKLFNIPDTKVNLKLRPIEKTKAIRRIDRAIEELKSQISETKKTSKRIELSNHIDTLSELLMLLQNDNETLFEVNTYVAIKDSKKDLVKKVKQILREDGFRLDDMKNLQYDTLKTLEISPKDLFINKSRSIHSTSLAAVFPFINYTRHDEKGINIGESNGYPAFMDFFMLDKERINSNMVILGKSGSGKSYAAKTILTNLAAEDSKIFILDPENEYSKMAHKLNGKVIDLGSATEGRLNPFHIARSIATDDEKKNNASAFSSHLQFLEEFFRQILPDLDAESMERLNSLVLRVYMQKGIDEETDISTLKPSDFPTFDDLYDAILMDYQKTQGDYIKAGLRTLLTFIFKFTTGGRMSNLWNGEATLEAEENFVVFNFQTLLANKNNLVANAQMLLILKWLDNEIIKNREYNIKNNTDRKIIVVIDEAHVFIDNKYPIALDFMFQLAKRIRKYNGMQIIITQNIKDFVGSEELKRKSAAIINSCQYSFIFSLAPNDISDLCNLYEMSGGINEQEKTSIIENGRGKAFVISGINDRSDVEIIATDEAREIFE
ncbi:MAG: ATP-binding protein [Clostridia bacterium]|nr:ATP-binding protein [Clostridia bacterium]